MAGSSVIGALRVVLGADTAALDKGLKDAQSGLASFGKAVSVGMLAVGAAVTAAAVSMGASIKTSIDAADKMNKVSQSTGVAVEELSKLAYAAELSDVPMEALSKSLGKLSKVMVEAANDGASAAGQAFTRMGIALKNQDGTLRSTDQVLSDVAGKFENYRDGAAKTALATQLFGKAGKDLIPLLNQGKQGLKEAGDELEKFGGVITKKASREAEQFNDNLKKLDIAKQGIWITITSKLLPSFAALSTTLVESRKGGVDMWAAAGDRMAQVMSGLVTIASGLITAWQQIFATLANLKVAFDQLKKGELSAAFDTMRKSAEETAAAFTDLKGRMTKLWAPDEVDNAMTEMSGHIDKFMVNVAAAGEAMKRDAPWNAPTDPAALNKFLASQQKRIAGMNAEIDAVGKGAGEQAKLKVVYEANAIAAANKIKMTDQLRDSINAMGNAAAQTALKLQGAQLIEQTAMPWDQRAQQVQQYSAAMMAAGATSDQLAIMQSKIQFPSFSSAAIAAADFGMQLDQIVTTSANGLAEALSGLVTGTKSAAEAFSAFAKSVIADLVAMIAKMLVFRALRAVIGIPFADGGAVGGTGLSLTATGGHYATGGPVWGAGTATSDSIPALLSNGEFVMSAAAVKNIGMPALSAMNSGKLPTVPTETDRVQASATAAQPKIIEVRGFNARDFYTRDHIASLIDALNDAIRDNYQLKVAN